MMEIVEFGMWSGDNSNCQPHCIVSTIDDLCDRSQQWYCEISWSIMGSSLLFTAWCWKVVLVKSLYILDTCSSFGDDSGLCHSNLASISNMRSPYRNLFCDGIIHFKRDRSQERSSISHSLIYKWNRIDNILTLFRRVHKVFILATSSTWTI